MRDFYTGNSQHNDHSTTLIINANSGKDEKSTFASFFSEEAEDAETIDKNTEASTSPVDSDSKGAGRPKTTLFESDEIKAQEASRVKRYIEQNGLVGFKWDTKAGNPINKMVYAFYKKWRELEFVSSWEHPSSSSIVDFFMEECGVQNGAGVDTLKNHVKPWGEQEIDEEVYRLVCAEFPK